MEPYRQFKKGDIIERYQGEPAETIKNNEPLTFKVYASRALSNNTLMVNESWGSFASKNFRKWVEVEPKQEPYREFKKGDLIERYQGEAVKSIKNNVPLTFWKYTPSVTGDNFLMLFSGDESFASKNFRKWVEIVPEPVKRKIKIGDFVSGPDLGTGTPKRGTVIEFSRVGNPIIEIGGVNNLIDLELTRHVEKPSLEKPKIKIGDEIQGLIVSGIVKGIDETFYIINSGNKITKDIATLIRTKEQIEADKIVKDNCDQIDDKLLKQSLFDKAKEIAEKEIHRIKNKPFDAEYIIPVGTKVKVLSGDRIGETAIVIYSDNKYGGASDRCGCTIEFYDGLQLRYFSNYLAPADLDHSITEAEIERLKNKHIYADSIFPVGMKVKVINDDRAKYFDKIFETGTVISSGRYNNDGYHWEGTYVEFKDGLKLGYNYNQLVPVDLDHSITEDPPVYDTGTDRLKQMAKQAKETGTEKSFIDALINGWIC